MNDKSGRSSAATATLFIAVNDGMLHIFDLSDAGLRDRVYVFPYPAYDGEDDRMLVDRVVKDPAVRQAVAAEIIRRAAKPVPPESTPSVLSATAGALAESVGDIGLLLDRIRQGAATDYLTTNALYDAAVEISGAQDGKPWGYDRTRLVSKVRRMRGLPPLSQQGPRGGRQRGFAGWILDEQPAEREG